MRRQPSRLDYQAAGHFAALARTAAFFDVLCRFGQMQTTGRGRSKGRHRQGSLLGRAEFEEYFGNAPDYFAGAVEYVRLATGWVYPRPALRVTLHLVRDIDGVSSGVVLNCPRTRPGEIFLSWRDQEFTVTVLHELVHIFRPSDYNKPNSRAIGLASAEERMREEAWAEAQAQRLVKGLE